MINGLGQFMLSLLAFFQIETSQFALSNPAPFPPPPRVQEQVSLPGILIPETLTAKAIIVANLDRGESLAEKNLDMLLPIASLSKIMTSFVAEKYLEPETKLTVSRDAVTTPGAAGDFEFGEQFQFEDLLTAMMMYSSNDAAMVVAEHVGEILGGAAYEEKISRFVSAMNENAKVLGMDHTIFQNPTGLDVRPSEPSNYSTARDLQRLVVEVRNNGNHAWELSRNAEKNIRSSAGKIHHLININELLDKVPHALGGKTGSTDAAGESVIVLYEYPLGKPGVLILLGAQTGQRFKEGEELLKQIMPLIQ